MIPRTNVETKIVIGLAQGRKFQFSVFSSTIMIRRFKRLIAGVQVANRELHTK